MHTITCIIIDDESHNIESLKILLKKYCSNVLVIAAENSAEKGILAIKKHHPDLVFLDIEMPVKNGFEMLESIPKIDFEVIFVTAYNKYVLKAIKSCALDYLMKPVDFSELKEAVLKVTKIIDDRKQNERLKTFVQNLKNTDTPPKIALTTTEALNFVCIDEIIRCKGENNYTCFYLTDGSSILVSKTLKEWDDLLSEYSFIRTHQSHLINSLHVKSFIKKDGGYILMNDGSIVSVARQRKEYTLNKLISL